MNTIDSLVTRFVSDLRTAIQQDLGDRIRQALGEQAKPLRATKVMTKHAKAWGGGAEPRKGAKRDPLVLAELTANLHRYVKAHPGLRIEQIGKNLEIPTKDLNLPVKKLIASGAIRTKGQKRSTTYFPKS